MYGLIGKFTAAPGQRDALVAVLLKGVAHMPGCLSYVVAHDSEDADGLWITEVWVDEEAHRASLALPAVKEAIAAGRPLIAGMSNFTATRPVGGHGLLQAS
jgi:quinol monooxygenase YgiN